MRGVLAVAEEQSSFDNLKLIVAAVVFALTCLSGAGIVPVFILVAGLVISLKGGDVGNIKVTTRLIQFCLIVGALVAALNVVSEYKPDNMAYTTGKCLGCFTAESPLAFAVDPQTSIYGASGKCLCDSDHKTSSPPIVKREAMTSYSTADELIKWRALHTDGVISAQEYEEARKKILNKS